MRDVERSGKTMRIVILFTLVLATGCATSPRATDTPAPKVASPDTASNSSSVSLAAHEESSSELVQPPSLIEPITPTPEELPRQGVLTVESLETMALASNPAIAQATARVRALRGKWVQVGLPPNPNVGYVAGRTSHRVPSRTPATNTSAILGQTRFTARMLE